MQFPSISQIGTSTRAWATGTVQRLVGYGLELYAARGGGIPADPPYHIEKAAALGRKSPWVYVCLQAVATDLASLPLIAGTGDGQDFTEIKGHWLPELLKRPHPKTSGRKFRKQIYADLRRKGNAYVRVWWGDDGKPYQFARIPPGIIRPLVADDGETVGWELGPSRKKLKWEEVLHMADFSFDEDENVVLGESPLNSLQIGLQVDIDARKQAGRAARRGRLEMIGSPKDGGIVVNKERLEAVARNYDSAVVEGNGLFLANQGFDFTPVSYTPRDGEFMEQGKATKSEILAAFQVPPIRAGDSAANYGTAKQQMRTYWEGLVGWAAIIDDEFSRLCEPGVRIIHSFAKVEALQTSFTERQTRALSWARDFGMDRKVAAQYEGFHDAPVPPGKYEPISAPKPDSPAAHGNPSPDEPRETKAVEIALANALEDWDSTEPEEWTRMLARSLFSVLVGICEEKAEGLAAEFAAECYAYADDDQTDSDTIREHFGSETARRFVEIAHGLAGR